MKSEQSDGFYFDESAEDLIRQAKERPPEPIIEGLLNVGEILVLHGTEESFKSIFVLQVAASICSRRPFLRRWAVPTSRRVGVLDTEMHRAGLGQRLGKLYASSPLPPGMAFFTEGALTYWRKCNFKDKFELLFDWVTRSEIDVLLIDTASDFFRGKDNPSDERIVGEFFDRIRNLPVKGRILVRHDRKKKEHDGGAHSNELIRGSARWKEDPEAIVCLKRVDKRTHEVCMEVGKLRYGAKPEPLQLWFDARCFRLIPLPPVIAVLEDGSKSREELVTECKQRFGIEERKVSDMIDDETDFIVRGQDGHKRTLELDPERVKAAPWYSFLECESKNQPMQLHSGPHTPGGGCCSIEPQGGAE